MEQWKRTFYASWIGQFLSITGFMAVLPFMPFFIRELGVTEPGQLRMWSGVISSAAGITLAIFSPIWGVLADRFGRKPMVLRSMFAGALVLPLMGYSQNVWQLFAWRLLQGALTGTVTASTAMVASAAPRAYVGSALGMMQAAVAVGASMGPWVGGRVADAFGYRAAFWVAGGILLLGALIVLWGVRETREEAPPELASTRAGFKALFTAGGFLAAVGALFAIRFSYSIGAPVFPLLVEAIRGSSERVASVTGDLLAVSAIASALAAAFVGPLARRWGSKTILILFALSAAVVAALHAAAPSIAALFVLRFLFGLGMGGMLPSANTIIRHAVHDSNIGKAYGVTSCIGAIGWTTGPYVGGAVAKHVGLRAPFLVMAVSLVVSALVVVVFVRDDRRSRAAPPPASG